MHELGVLNLFQFQLITKKTTNISQKTLAKFLSSIAISNVKKVKWAKFLMDETSRESDTTMAQKSFRFN